MADLPSDAHRIGLLHYRLIFHVPLVYRGLRPFEQIRPELREKILQQNGWQSTTDPGDFNFSEAVYFYKFVAKFLYETDSSFVDSYVLQTDPNSPIKIQAQFDSRTLSFNLERHSLQLFKPGSAMMRLELACKGHVREKRPLTLADALEATDKLRRVFAAYYEAGLGGGVPKEVTVGGCVFTSSNQEEEQTTHLKSNLSNNPLILGHWAAWLAPFDLSKQNPDWNMPADERVPVMVYLELEKSEMPHAKFAQISEADWWRIAECDPIDTNKEKQVWKQSYSYHEYNRDHLEGLKRTCFYDRFMPDQYIGPGSATRQVFGGAVYSLVTACEVDKKDSTKDKEPGFQLYIFRGHYEKIARLAHFNHNSLLAFSSQVSDIVTMYRGEPETFRHKMRDLREEFMIFTHRYWFTGVSNQIQPSEMFALWRKSLRLDDLFKEVRQEINDASDFANSQDSVVLARKANYLSVVGLVVAVLVAIPYLLDFALVSEAVISLQQLIAQGFSRCCQFSSDRALDLSEVLVHVGIATILFVPMFLWLRGRTRFPDGVVGTYRILGRARRAASLATQALSWLKRRTRLPDGVGRAFAGYKTRIHVLRIEGANFDACLYDTDDLSVVRGASLLMEEMPERVKNALEKKGIRATRQVFGGSLAVFQVRKWQAKRAVNVARACLAQDEFAHLSFFITRGQGDSVAAAANQAANLAKREQLQAFTFQPFATDGATRPDAFDKKRPAKKETFVKQKPSSQATFDRQAFGRDQRKKFFLDAIREHPTINDQYIKFCDTLGDLVTYDQATRPHGIPETLINKIALIHLDGDRFSKAAEVITPAEFSGELEKKLGEVLDRWVQDTIGQEPDDTNGKRTFRMQVLIWGGDDLTLVVPAWRALPVLEGFYEVTNGWKVKNCETKKEVELSFTAGVTIANKKAPVRLLTRLAEASVRKAKEDGFRNSVSFDIFESVAPMEQGELAGYRQRRLPSGMKEKQNAEDMPYAFDAKKLDVLKQTIAHLKAPKEDQDPVARHKLYQLLTIDDDAKFEEAFDTYLQRTRNLSSHAAKKSLKLPFGGEQGEAVEASHLRTHIFWITQLWDYVQAAPSPPAGEGTVP